MPGASRSGLTLSKSVGPRLLMAAVRFGSPATAKSFVGAALKSLGRSAPHVCAKPGRGDAHAPTVRTFLALAGVPTVL